MEPLHLIIYRIVFREQRVTALAIGVLSGAAVFITNVLKVSYIINSICPSYRKDRFTKNMDNIKSDLEYVCV